MMKSWKKLIKCPPLCCWYLKRWKNIYEEQIREGISIKGEYTLKGRKLELYE